MVKKKSRRSISNHTGVYPFLVTIPDRLYPFRAEVEGKMVRGKKAYDLALLRARRKLGPGRLGYKVLAYRQACHLIGALMLIIVSTLVAQDVFGSAIALYTLLSLAMLGVTFQEFYLHPKYYGQLWKKSLADWAVWVSPIAFFIYVNLH